jgi:hypothetical protein
MNEQLEAIKEAISFIQSNWVGKSGVWRGSVSDFVGAVIKNAVTVADIKCLVQAINDGEPTTVEDLGGTIAQGELITVWVSKCME